MPPFLFHELDGLGEPQMQSSLYLSSTIEKRPMLPVQAEQGLQLSPNSITFV